MPESPVPESPVPESPVPCVRDAARSAHRRLGERGRPPPGAPRTCRATTAPSASAASRRPTPYDVRWFANRWPALAPGEPIDFAAITARAQRGAPRRPPPYPRSARPRSCCSRPSTASRWRAFPSRRCARSSTCGPSAPRRCSRATEIEYVLVFENRGRDVGATIDHPHGQIYGYPFVPPAPAREVAAAAPVRVCARSRGRDAIAGSRVVARARRLGRVGAVRVRLRVRHAVRAAYARRLVARARRRTDATISRVCSSTRSAATTASGRRPNACEPLPLPVVVPPGARERRRRLARARARRAAVPRAGRAALRRVGRAGQRHALQHRRARRRGARALRDA